MFAGTFTVVKLKYIVFSVPILGTIMEINGENIGDY